MLVVIVKIIGLYILFVSGFSFLIFQLGYFIFGFFSLVRGHELSEEDIRLINEKGISHKTTSKGYKGIRHDGKIKGRAGRKAYSNHFMKAAYLFANAYMEEGEQFNENPKYEYMISVGNLSSIQIEKIRIRDWDKALIVKGDFIIEKQNTIEYKELKQCKMGFREKIRYRVHSIKNSCKEKDKYKSLLVRAMGLAFIIILAMMVIVWMIVSKYYVM